MNSIEALAHGRQVHPEGVVINGRDGGFLIHPGQKVRYMGPDGGYCVTPGATYTFHYADPDGRSIHIDTFGCKNPRDFIRA